MFATIESMLLLDKAEELASLVLKSEPAEEYRRSFYKLKYDQIAQQLILQFAKTKDLYEDVQRFGKYHPDYRKISKDMRDIKRELDLNENVAHYKQAENELQALLDEISVHIGHAVSLNIKVPTGNPFFDTGSSCGGGCGSGGSCGCKVS